jgi:hypothetical protein
MRQSLGDCTGQDVFSCICLFFIKLYLRLMLGRLERLFALAEAGKLAPESPLAERGPRTEGGVASAAGQASARRNQDLISGLWASFVGWASSNPSYGSAAGGSAETDPANVASAAAPDAPAAPAVLAAPAVPAATLSKQGVMTGPDPAIHDDEPVRPCGMIRSRPGHAPNLHPSPSPFRPRRAQAPPRVSGADLFAQITSGGARIGVSLSFRCQHCAEVVVGSMPHHAEAH